MISGIDTRAEEYAVVFHPHEAAAYGVHEGDLWYGARVHISERVPVEADGRTHIRAGSSTGKSFAVRPRADALWTRPPRRRALLSLVLALALGGM
jgi:hypothetical protein